MNNMRAQVICSGAIVAAPQHGALAGGVIDDDVSRLIGAVLAKLHVIEIDAGAAQALDLDAAALVVADAADVFHPQPEAGARHHGTGHLAARAHDFFFKRHFARVSRKVRHDQERIGGVQPDAHNVEFRHGKSHCNRCGRLQLGPGPIRFTYAVGQTIVFRGLPQFAPFVDHGA
jgi:hypothetical protein